MKIKKVASIAVIVSAVPDPATQPWPLGDIDAQGAE
jgi:hypothetical protein